MSQSQCSNTPRHVGGYSDKSQHTSSLHINPTLQFRFVGGGGAWVNLATSRFKVPNNFDVRGEGGTKLG